MQSYTYNKQDEPKVYSKVISKETSIANPSFRVYYGGLSGSVPFMWESQPGTPKHKFSDHSLPPLTPPPSYYTANNNCNDKSNTKNNSRYKLNLHTLFMRIILKKGHMPSSPISSPLSSSSSLSSYLSMRKSSCNNGYRRRRFLSVGSSLDGFEMNTDEKIRGCFSTRAMKKALLSVVGCGSGKLPNV